MLLLGVILTAEDYSFYSDKFVMCESDITVPAVAAAGDDAAFPAHHDFPFPSSSTVRHDDVADGAATMLPESTMMLTTSDEDIPISAAMRDVHRQPYNASPAAAAAAAAVQVEVNQPHEYANFSDYPDWSCTETDDLGFSWPGDLFYK